MHWEYLDRGNAAVVYCPILTKGVTSFKIKREIYEEFKELELKLSSKYKMIYCHTRIKYPNVIRMLAKLGTRPFSIDLKEDIIWFVKDLGGYDVWRK